MIDIYESFIDNERKIVDRQRQIEDAYERAASGIENEQNIRILERDLDKLLDNRKDFLKRYRKLIGRNLLKWRKLSTLSQEELAKAIDVTFFTCLRYEHGDVTPRYETLQKMISVLNEKGIEIQIEDLFLDDKQETESFKELYLSPQQRMTVNVMETLNQTGQEAALSRVIELSEIPRYKKEDDV